MQQLHRPPDADFDVVERAIADRAAGPPAPIAPAQEGFTLHRMRT